MIWTSSAVAVFMLVVRHAVSVRSRSSNPPRQRRANPGTLPAGRLVRRNDPAISLAEVAGETRIHAGDVHPQKRPLQRQRLSNRRKGPPLPLNWRIRVLELVRPLSPKHLKAAI